MAEPQIKLPGLQIGRAIAALTIAYIHSWHVTMPFPPGTAFPLPFAERLPAVPLFFAISGFVICMMTEKPDFRAPQFLARRAFRLYPLWIVTSAIFLYLSVKWLGLPERSTPTFIAYSLTLLPTEGYPFYDLGWSLQHEAAFYVLAALLVPWLGLFGLAAFLCVGIAVDHLVTLPWYLHQYASYYPNFIAGIVAFVTMPHSRFFGVWIPVAIGCTLFVLSVIAASSWLGPLALFFLLLGFVNIRSTTMLPRIGVLLGDASYSIYLIHPLVFYYVYAKLQPPLPPVWSQEFLRFGSIAIICMLSIASWRLFESPTIRFGNRLLTVSRHSRLRRRLPVASRLKGAGSEGDPEAIDPAHPPSVLEGLAQAKRRQFATDDELEAALRRFDR